MGQRAGRMAVCTLVVLGVAACGGSGSADDPPGSAATAESTELPSITSSTEETTPPIPEAERPATVDDTPEEAATTLERPPGPAGDDEVARANRWNGYDLDCSDFTITDIRIVGPDPNGLDRDRDGIGCES
jgi:hypothetical protein